MQQDAAGQFALVAGGGGGFCTVDTNGHLSCAHAMAVMTQVESDSRQVELYAVHSPQNWFEDFGSGRLADGSATVALEPTFAQTVNTASGYHVFLTPRGDCEGLYVARATTTGFEVRELRGGHSNLTFDYRIVALRRGYENVRLEDKTAMMAKLKANTPKMSPTPGERWVPPSRSALIPPASPSNSHAVLTPAKLATGTVK
jgi:hypothetical protein